jgi:hypothetical protein
LIKDRLILFLLLLLPLMLLGNSAGQSKAFASALISNPTYSYALDDNHNPLKELPALNISRDRSWRLQSIIRETSDSGDFAPAGIDSVYYTNSTSTAIDSISSWIWLDGDSSWYLNSYLKYHYDTAGDYVTQLDFGTISGNTSSVEIKHCYYYDNENHLIHRNVLEYDSGSQEFDLSSRTHYAYSNGVITDISSYYAGAATPYITSHFVSDANGRMTAENSLTSADSVNWNYNYAYTYVWNTNDASTGAQYAQFLAHYLPFYNMWDSMVFGMVDEKDMLSYWNGSAYSLHQRIVYYYNTSGMITSQVLEFWNGSDFENGSRQVYTYDIYGNVDEVYWQNWDPLQEMWHLMHKRNTYIWSQTTVNQDETVIPVQFGISVSPNPFDSDVNIRIDSKSNAPVRFSIFNVKGQLVKNFDHNSKSAVWDGRDNDNQPAGNGIYFIKALQDGATACRKVIRIH